MAPVTRSKEGVQVEKKEDKGQSKGNIVVQSNPRVETKQFSVVLTVEDRKMANQHRQLSEKHNELAQLHSQLAEQKEINVKLRQENGKLAGEAAKLKEVQKKVQADAARLRGEKLELEQFQTNVYDLVVGQGVTAYHSTVLRLLESKISGSQPPATSSTTKQNEDDNIDDIDFNQFEGHVGTQQLCTVPRRVKTLKKND